MEFILHFFCLHGVCAAGGLQPFPPINIAPDISPDMAPPMAKKVRSEADDLIPEQHFIAEHPVRPLYYSIILCTLLCVVQHRVGIFRGRKPLVVFKAFHVEKAFVDL